MPDNITFTPEIRHDLNRYHDFISLSHYDFIQKLVDTKYFQRLRHLYQLGVSSFVYPTATHSRLSHSLGTMELFGKIFDNIHKHDRGDDITNLRKLGMSAMLLHDIGHGPFSHMSEKIFNFKHEELTVEIIQSSEVKEILEEGGVKADDIVKLIKNTSPPEQKHISQLVSSELDADRLDYLSRDAYFTGVLFGKIDLQRIIRTLEIYSGGGDIDGYVVTSNKGTEALESYVLGRHLMYQGVYYHKTTRGFERLIQSLFKRAISLHESKKPILPDSFSFFTNGTQLTADDLIDLDDHVMYNLIKQWTKHDDAILKDLATRIINRNPLKSLEIENYVNFSENQDKIKKSLEKNGFDPDYYLLLDQAVETPYSPYSPKGAEDKANVITNIFVLNKNNVPEEISQVSNVVKTLSNEIQTNVIVYLPDVCKDETLSTLGLNAK